MSRTRRVFLSPPHLTGTEMDYIAAALKSNWVAPVGPNVDAFEAEFAETVGASHAVAVSSGTAALHLALDVCGVGPGDVVPVSTLTFIASVAPIIWQGAKPVFVDSERASWNMDAGHLDDAIRGALCRGERVGAVVLVHLYGQCANLRAIQAVCCRHGVDIVEDAAEALGSEYAGRSPGTFGRTGAFSFNGNKIITTSGGGMLVTGDRCLAERARFLASQARDPAPHYEHSTLGNNYRMSNILAGVGRAQLQSLHARVARRREIFELYQQELADSAGLAFMPEAPWGRTSRWLTVVLIDERAFGASREDVRMHLESHNIEARPVWKPMHLQPVFRGERVCGGRVAEDLFRLGLCLPSGSAMDDETVMRVARLVRTTPRRDASGPADRRGRAKGESGE